MKILFLLFFVSCASHYPLKDNFTHRWGFFSGCASMLIDLNVHYEMDMTHDEYMVWWNNCRNMKYNHPGEEK